MISGEMLQELEATLRAVRGCPLPWGGVRLVFCGDFSQLPPIPSRVKDGEKTAKTFLNRGFAFQAPVWARSELHHVLLKKVFRQADPEFVEVLEAVRWARAPGPALRKLIAKCARPLPARGGVKPTRM
ncbi:MAG: hypothetical protein J3K34DRAFT_431333 [Monoraphidium minutum]|nr:MAG: hypothetical protein J3K34DRAFT_431333 [Monoraphidium minutum]